MPRAMRATNQLGDTGKHLVCRYINRKGASTAALSLTKAARRAARRVVAEDMVAEREAAAASSAATYVLHTMHNEEHLGCDVCIRYRPRVQPLRMHRVPHVTVAQM
jgi:hypothetical protein